MINATAPTCLHLPIKGRRSIQNQTLYLQELIRLVASNNGEPKPSTALLQFGIDEGPVQF